MLNPFILLLVMVVSFLFISKDYAIILPVIVSSVIGFIVIIAFLKRLVNVGFSQIISASYSKDLMMDEINLSNLGMKGKKAVESLYSESVIISKLEAIYNSVTLA